MSRQNYRLPLLSLGLSSIPGVLSAAEAVAPTHDSVLGFLGIFFVGLMLNLTPCVYPMLAITVSLLSRPGGEKSAQAFTRSLVYVLGMSTMYSALGVSAALTGGLFGSILQSPVVLLLISLMFLLLALSTFGLYELQLPASVLNRIGTNRSGSLAGLFVSGLFVGVFAAPCVGPPVIALLTMVGQRGDALYGFAVFFTLSLGLGLPYLILGTFSGLMQNLPRSGHWMIWIKKLMGIVLIALAAFYAALAASPQLSFTLIPLILLIGGLYSGFIESVPGSGSAFRFLRYAVGILFIALSIYGWSLGRLETITWDKYPGSIGSDGKPAILYFSASWCIPCLEIDRLTLTDPDLPGVMSSFKRYKIDLSSFDSEESRSYRSKYQIVGVPTMIFLDSDGNQITGERTTGFISSDDLKMKLNRILTGSARAEQKTEAPGADKPMSNLQLISEYDVITPGMDFYLAAHFSMEPGWHIYWKNPGDSGTEPEINWKLPPGFSVSEPEWPAPQHFIKPPFGTYGHTPDLVLPLRVKAPLDIATGTTLELGLDASWLVCDEICIGQDGSASLRLTLGEKAVVSQAQPIISQSLATAPVEDHKLEASVEYDKRTATITVSGFTGISTTTMAGAYLYPEDQGIFRHGYNEMKVVNNTISFSLVRTGLPFPERLGAVLVLPVARDVDQRFFKFSIKSNN
ncbi:MAG: cytochrome c biogenesis protein CcdA [Candidatus Rifleibacteriota bacterium]